MTPTWFLSMWISNSATAAMMVTICLAVISQLEESEKQVDPDSNSSADANPGKIHTDDDYKLEMSGSDIELTTRNGVENPGYDTMTTTGSSETLARDSNDGPSEYNNDSVREEREGKWVQRGKGLLMCVAYSASIGGIATITGTAPNLIFSENLER